MRKEQKAQDMIYSPAHYTVYPVQPIEITAYLGFCLSNATKYVLRAPYKGGEEDCLKALVYLGKEYGNPQPFIGLPCFKRLLIPLKNLILFLSSADGDLLWHDIADEQDHFLRLLHSYLASGDPGDIPQMQAAVRDLRRILSLRDTTGQIYEGMSGLPKIMGDSNA